MIDGSGPYVDIPLVEKEVIVDLHCGAAILRGAIIYVPGIMGAHPGESVSHSTWLGVFEEFTQPGKVAS